MSAPNVPAPTGACRARAAAHSASNRLRAVLGRRRAAESRARALRGVGNQGELGHQQQAAADLAQVQVHAPLGIREDPVGEDPFQQPLAGVGGVILFHADEGQDAPVDGSDRLPADVHLRASDPLDERYQSMYPVEFGLQHAPKVAISPAGP